MKKNKTELISRKEYLNAAKHIIPSIKKVAKEYYLQTGRPLGVTGEIAEYETIRLLQELQPCTVRAKGVDALMGAKQLKIQIKGRVKFPGTNKSQRVGSISKKCNAVILVILNPDYHIEEMRIADYRKVKALLDKPGSIARNERRQMNTSQFKRISKPIDFKKGKY